MSFLRMPVTERSLAYRKPIYGKGINDANYRTSHVIDGSQALCPIYSVWRSMLARCYSSKCIKKKPTYTGVTVCNEWLTFSNFAEWMERQDYQGKALDKDIRIKGNKIYSPDACKFVTLAENNIEARAINYIFTDPKGRTVKIYNMEKFCRDNNLNSGHMTQVNLGNRQHHKQWRKVN